MGDYIGECYRLFKGDTRSSEYSSYSGTVVFAGSLCGVPC